VRGREPASLARLVLVLELLLLGGCAPSGVTAKRLESAVASTFANLIHVQEPILGGPAVEASALRSSATCQKVGLAADGEGGGTWRCTIDWYIPGRQAPVRDSYDLSVTNNGCYTATADGTEAHVGGATLKTLRGTTVTNLLYAFDGCFDTT
jgi:hypothetical protein